MGRASGRAGVIQNGVGLVETCKSEAGSLIQPTPASRWGGNGKRLKPQDDREKGAHHLALAV